MKSNPPMPGEVLTEYIDGLSLKDAASKIGIDPKVLSRLLEGSLKINGDLAIKIGLAVGTSAELWNGLQSAFDSYAVSNPLSAIAPQVCKPQDMDASLYLPDWEAMAPVGREFGSPDYERLEELDHLAFKVKGSLEAARRWLDSPNEDLEGLTPDEVSRSQDGFLRVKRLLQL